MEDKEESLLKHLEELRKRIIKCAIFIFVASTISYNFVDRIYMSLARPVGKLVFLEPQEAFMARIKIAFFVGSFLSLPFVLYQTWRFISVGLKDEEKKYALIYGPLSFVFFILGSIFGYAVIVPVGTRFLLGFGTDQVVPLISVSKYISFVTLLTFAFGLSFELPLAILFLTKIGFVTPQFLSRKRRHAVVAIFIIAAVLTPPDVVTQCLMAFPMVILYELGIIFSKIAFRKKER